MRDVKELSLKFGGNILIVETPCFFVFLGALFEQNGDAQTGILTNKTHYEETMSFEHLNFPAKLHTELFDVTNKLPAPRWRRSVVEFWERFRSVIAHVRG